MEKVKEICSRDQCRDKFKELGLSYRDISEGDILSLVLMINREIEKSRKSGELSVKTIRLSGKMDMKCEPDGTIKECYLYMNSDYFKQRECISFNKDGFIGICGWADIKNSSPVKRAFLGWCDELAKQKTGTFEKRGKWVPEEDGFGGYIWHCSACGAEWTFIEGGPVENGTNFCPECGADLRPTEDERAEWPDVFLN